MQLKIDPEFKNLIPPLRDEEYANLRDNIKKNGCRDSLIAWDGVIVDGHNRYKICKELDKRFHVHEMTFSDRDEAMDFIDRNQTSRRNLSPDDFKLIIGRIYNRTKKTYAEAGGLKSRCQNDTGSAGRTREQLAKEYKVSASTITRAGKMAEAAENIQKENPTADRSEVIKKAKEISRPKETRKTKTEKEKEVVEQKKRKPVVDYNNPLQGDVAVRYARMAICQLESIQRTHYDRDKAFDMVIEWINKNR